MVSTTFLCPAVGVTNKDRQVLTQETVQHALEKVRSKKSEVKNLLFIAHETYQPGVIGLVAGRLVEEFYRPSIVVSIGEIHSKASARSVAGFNIIEFIRTASHLLVDAGGHPMAAGFTVETGKIHILKDVLEKAAEQIGQDQLVRTLKIDMEIPVSFVSEKLFKSLQQLSPFGMKNAEPVFADEDVVIEDLRLIGKEFRHVKLKLKKEKTIIDAIGFNLSEQVKEIKIGDSISVAFVVDENVWNGRTSLQLKIRDIKKG